MIVQILLVAIVSVLLAALVRSAFRPVVVYEFERGLRYAKGKFSGVLAPGFYWSFQPLSEVRKIDIRPVFAAVAGQEVLSSDGVALKVSLAAKYEVADPGVAVHSIENFRDALPSSSSSPCARLSVLLLSTTSWRSVRRSAGSFRRSLPRKHSPSE